MSFDINSIKMDDIKDIATEEETTNSEVEESEETNPASTETASEEVETETENEAVTEEGNEDSAPEGKTTEPTQKANKNFSRVERAEYSAAKWKKKFKNMQRQYNDAIAEFNKYKNFNPANFENAQDAHEFMAWKASAQQRLEDMNADMRSFYNEKREEDYNRKIETCFSSEEAAEEFNNLDEQYSEAFDYLCKTEDPDNVVADFVENSKFEPALRTVIFKNPKLQEDLFPEGGFANGRIAAIKRMQILEALENQVKAFYQNGPTQKATQPVTPANKTVKRYQLPSNKPTAVKTAPKVTGSLTKGNEVGEINNDALAAKLYKQIYG